MFFEWRWKPKIDWPELYAMEVFAGIDEDGEVFYADWPPELPTSEKHDTHKVLNDLKVRIK